MKNEVRNNLARISLRWMIRECFKLKTGILFNRGSFKIVGMDPASLWPHVKERPESVTAFSGGPPPLERKGMHLVGVNGSLGQIDDFISEEEEDLGDALSDKNDMLKISPSWWILEFVPQKIRFQKDDNSWVRKLSYVLPNSIIHLPKLKLIDLAIYRINLGRGRVVPKQREEGIKIHRTVKLRMEMKKEKGKLYEPKAKLARGIAPTWVD